jgi:hypothetical protein
MKKWNKDYLGVERTAAGWIRDGAVDLWWLPPNQRQGWQFMLRCSRFRLPSSTERPSFAQDPLWPRAPHFRCGLDLVEMRAATSHGLKMGVADDWPFFNGQN